jgi:2-(1,2-epoxy-1,2-dihydrophenyl)acetyl-CoA isomerase
MTWPLRLALDGVVATLTLDRPDCGNAIDVAMAEALLAAAIEVANDAAVRAVVLTGAGAMFCAGGDVGAFVAAGSGAPALIHRITAPLHAAIAKLAHMHKPLVTAINGAAAGAGLGLAMLGDVAIAARSAKFAAAYGALGLTPDAGVSWLLPRLVGLRQAQRLVLAGDRVDAAEALRIGLVGEVVEDDALVSGAQVTAERLADLSGPALHASRALLREAFSTGFEAHLEREAQGIAHAAGHRHGQEGIAAFAARRRPLFD